jgi:toxin ParE1/3/4
VDVKWLRTALANLEEEVAYVARDNHPAAVKLARSSVGAVEGLKQFPAKGRPGKVPGTRELVIPGTPYIVPYRVRGDFVEVLRVFHTSRKWPSVL